MTKIWTKLKAFADNKIKVAKMMIFVFHKVQKVLGKGENAGIQHFLLFPQCFQKAFTSRSLKVGIMWRRIELNIICMCVSKESLPEHSVHFIRWEHCGTVDQPSLPVVYGRV